MILQWADGNGGVKEVLSLPTASETVKGGIKVGENLYMVGESLNASPMGGISFGNGLHFDDGELTFDPMEGVTVGDGLYFDNGSLNAAPAVYWCNSMADLPANPQQGYLSNPQQGYLAIADNTPYFYGGGSWTPFQYNVFVGATSYADGEKGLVPKPIAGEQNKVLHGNGLWAPFLLDTVSSTLEGAMWLSVL